MNTSLTIDVGNRSVSSLNVTVTRVIFNQGYPIVKNLTRTDSKINKTTNYLDIINSDYDDNNEDFSKEIKGSFRIGYIVQSMENFDLTITVDHLELESPILIDSIDVNFILVLLSHFLFIKSIIY